jgi:hypothetical protein
MNMRIGVIDLAAMVDRLAELKAMIAPLQSEEENIKDLLKASGRERIDGTEHTAVVSLSERETIDTKTLKLDHPKLVEPYLKRSVVTAIKLTARRTH